MNFLGKKRWFTLIEMLIVIVIIGVLASALIPRLGSARGKANDVARKADLQQIATALISRQLDTNQRFNQLCTNTYCDIITLSWALAGTLTSIPSDKTNAWTSFSWVMAWADVQAGTGGGYILYPILKNGAAGNGFVLMAKVETEGWANFSTCSSNQTGLVYENIQASMCEGWFTKGTTCATRCTYTDASQLRYLYLY